MSMPYKQGGGVIKRSIRVNERIRVPSLRIIGPEGEQLGILSRDKALEQAKQYDLDLVEVAPSAQPPVCRIMDFSKYKYEQARKDRQAKKHQTHVRLKEIRVKPHIEKHDYEVKLKQLHAFLEKGNKVKVNLFFRGREITHQEFGKQIMDRFIQDSRDKAIVEVPPMRQGRLLSFVLAPPHK